MGLLRVDARAAHGVDRRQLEMLQEQDSIIITCCRVSRFSWATENHPRRPGVGGAAAASLRTGQGAEAVGSGAPAAPPAPAEGTEVNCSRSVTTAAVVSSFIIMV